MYFILCETASQTTVTTACAVKNEVFLLVKVEVYFDYMQDVIFSMFSEAKFLSFLYIH